MRKLHVVKLKPEERTRLQEITRKGVVKVRMLRRAEALLLSDDGMRDERIAERVGISVSTVERTRKRYLQAGLDAALTEKPRPGAEPRLDAKAEAYLVALACSDPPEGRDTWTMQLLADRLVELNYVESISDETVRRRLKKTAEAVAEEAVVHRAGHGRVRVADGGDPRSVRREPGSAAPASVLR
jgi:transposase